MEPVWQGLECLRPLELAVQVYLALVDRAHLDPGFLVGMQTQVHIARQREGGHPPAGLVPVAPELMKLLTGPMARPAPC